ncbi:MAG: methionine--tRNA ligase [Spirochaetota bacterium]|nr:methionine--tRNA ligase [Spirochaetota bacterium]
MKKRRLITSALPYVNNIPHLGNLIQVLSADVFARFCRSNGYETLYICGTDEYGTATETKALEEGVSPKELCDRYFVVHDEIYRWFGIKFDHFGRTSRPKQTEIVQYLFKKVDENGYISENTIEQLYCESCQRYLADRYVRGTCPHCGYEDARGDQCEHCGKLLDPTDLIDPRCGVCDSTPVVRETRHLYINLPALLPKLQEWMDKASVEGFWARNAIQMTKSWIRDGLKERAITRDLKWGIPVPKEGYEDKVFYVWFDAPIGYISITADLTDEWESWWKNPDEVELFQFIGKDNIPFHTVIFPCTLLASGDNWTMLHHMSSTEYLNYESGKFSKSKGIGVFGNDAKDTGIPADVWRFYIFYNRPEKSDAVFAWDDFQEKVNGELIGNLSNLVNRTLTFVVRFFDGKIPEFTPEPVFVDEVKRQEAEITGALEHADLRDGFRKIFALSSYGNREFQAGEPWRTRTSDPAAAQRLIGQLVYLVRDLAIMVEPYIPHTSDRILGFLGQKGGTWERLGEFSGLSTVDSPQILFERLEDSQISDLRERFSGSQAERLQKAKEKESMDEEKKAAEEQMSIEDRFTSSVDLRIARITEIERHPEADKLYIETIDAGDPEPRTIVSGLVPYYEEEELREKNIILVYNLKPAKLRGVKSQGMLLAAEKEGDENRETVEVLFVEDVEPGARLSLEGRDLPEEPPKKIRIDQFFDIPITVKDNTVMVGDAPLTVSGRKVTTSQVKQGKVG